MAIIVPVLMGAAGVSMSTIALTSVAFAVTGISAKINEAAAGVFGKDLVQIGNLFGAAYGAFSGGFGALGGGAEAATGLEAVNGMDAASDVFTASGSTGAGDFGSLADMGGSGIEGANMMDASAEGLTNEARAFGEMGGDMDSFNASVNGGESANVIDSMADFDPVAKATETGMPQSLIPNTGAAAAEGAGVQASGTQAAGTQAAGAQGAAPVQQAAGPNAAAPVTGPGAYNSVNGSDVMSDNFKGGTGGFGPPKVADRSFFNRLLFDEKGNVSSAALRTGGELVKGVGSGYQAAQKAKEDRRMFDEKMAEQRRTMNQRTGIRVTN